MICKACSEQRHMQCDDIRHQVQWVEYIRKNKITKKDKRMTTAPYDSCPCQHK